MTHCSTAPRFGPERVRGADIMVMRELCGGAMFTPTRGIEETDEGRRGYDLNEYTDAGDCTFCPGQF